MTRLLAALLIPVLAMLTSSCGCKQPPNVPKLRSMPKFEPLTTEPMSPTDPVQPKEDAGKVIREK